MSRPGMYSGEKRARIPPLGRSPFPRSTIADGASAGKLFGSSCFLYSLATIAPWEYPKRTPPGSLASWVFTLVTPSLTDWSHVFELNPPGENGRQLAG